MTDAYPYIPGAFAGSGGGGAGSAAGALLRQTGRTDLGLWISASEADESWHLRGELREDAEASTGSTAVFSGATSANSLTLSFFDSSDSTLKRFMPLVGDDRQDEPETVNTYRFNYVQYPDPTTPVLAFYDYGDLRITSATEGLEGNDDRVMVSIGTAATNDQNAHADIPLYNGTPGVLRAGQIRVTSPDRAQAGERAVASVNPLNRIELQAVNRGSAGNNLTVSLRRALNTSQSEAELWTAVYSTATNLNVTVTFNSGDETAIRDMTVSLAVAAINAARDGDGNQLIQATDLFPANTDTVRLRPPNVNGLFTGGTDVSGGGSVTNFGSIDLVSSGSRSAAVQASVTWGNVVLTANAAGAFPNDGKYQAQVVGTNSGGHQFRVTRSDLTGGRHFQILIDSSVGSAPTVAQVIQGLNDADTEDLITASAASGVSDTSVAWTGTGTESFTGGADAVNPLSAVWDEDTHTLTITALDSDPASAVITTITALDEFGTNVGPGYVRLAGGGLNSGVINVDNTVGNTLEYNFAGGTDGAPRSNLAVANRNDPDGDGNILVISGLISGDTTQDVIDAYRGARFTLTSVSSDGTTVFTNPTALATTSLTGGQVHVARQLPRVYVSDATAGTLRYTIEYHGSDTDLAERTTLAELKTAWENIPEVDGVQGNTPTIVDAGSLSDTMGTPPVAPTGGDNYVPAGDIEALVRPEDEVNGPNIEVRYDPDRDTLEEIALALTAQGAVSVVEVYGTDNTAEPEAPGFDPRTLFFGGGFGTTTSTTADPFDLHDDVSRQASTVNPNGLDRFLMSQEAVAGDPNAFITSENVRTFMKGYVGPWSGTPGGFVFRKGDITDHSGQWYVTSVQHTKQANGPDTDPTNFQAVTSWGGAWASGYYHVGTFVTHSSNVYVASQGVTNSDPAPTHADNTKWVQISGGGSSGITQTQADARYLQLSGGTMTGKVTLDGAPTSDRHAATKKYVDDNSGGATPTSLAGLTVPAWASGSDYTAWTILRDPHGRIYVTTQDITNSTIPPARSTDFQAIAGYEGHYADNTGYPVGAIVVDGSDDVYFVVSAVPENNTTAPADSTSFVQINGGGDGTTVEANPSESADGGDLTKINIDGTVYDIPTGGGDAGGGSGLTEVYDSGSFAQITADTWVEAAVSEAFSDNDQLIFLLQRRFGAGSAISVAQAPVSSPWSLIAESDLTTHSGNAQQASTQLVIENLGTVTNDAETAISLRKRTDGSIGYLLKDPLTSARVRIYKAPLGGAAAGTEVEANPSGEVDSGALTKIDVDGSIYSVGTGTGGGPTLSDATPESAGTADAGTSTEASRADHVHAAELGDDVITPAMLDADGDSDKLALRTRIGAVSARANPSEAVDGGELTKLDIDGTIYEVPEGTFTLSDKVGDTITGIGATAVEGPDFADLTPVIWLSFSYTRTPNSSLRFNTLVRKADMEGVVSGSAYRLQAQGAGGAYFSLYDSNDKLAITNSDTNALPTVTLDVYNVKGATGGTGGGVDLALSDPQPLGTADPGTGTEASRSDHVHPSELVDDSITPAMLVADSAGEKAAMRTRIGAGTSNVGNTQIDARINAVARTGNTDKWPTNKLDDDVVLSAELTAAIAGFLSQTQVDARVTALVNALALASNTARWGKTKVPSDTVYDADIVNFRTETQINTLISNALANFSQWDGQWAAGDAYTEGEIVRHNAAAYIAIQAVGANTNATTEPGVGSDWTTSWFRLGYENGAPSSLVTPTFDTGNGELVLTDRSGTAHRTAIPTGGTTVAANPSGSDGTDLDRISVGGANYNIPHFRPIQIGNANFGNSPDGNFRLHTSGTGIDKPASIATGEWWGVTFSSQQAGRNLRIFPADEVPTTEAGVAANDNNGLAIGVSHNRDIFLAFNSAGKLVAAGSNNSINVNEVTLFRMGLGDDPAAGPANLHPSIASFTPSGGDLSPVAGSIANAVYSSSWAISQSDHVGSARIIGFKGTFNSANVAVLHTLAAGNYANGSATYSIPAGVTLAADETYTQRLQVFDEDITSPGNATQPAAYHDIVIRAHEAATANYVWGYAEQVDGETAAQTAARIAGWTNWRDTDTTDGGTSTETDGSLNTTTGYSAFAPDVSDSAGTNLFVFFLAVKSGQTKPTGWSGNGLDASGAFQAAVDDDVGSTTYTFYIFKDYLSRNHADGDIRYIPRTT